jgi:D-alanine-D-alanine ligase
MVQNHPIHTFAPPKYRTLPSAMAKKKLRIGILFGGRSGEHEVSLLSAASILKAIDRKRYDVVPIGIDKQGHWLTGSAAERLLAANPLLPSGPAASRSVSAADEAAEFAAAAAVLRSGESLHIPAHPQRRSGDMLDSLEIQSSAQLAQPSNPLAHSLDVIFPVLHGTFGEDGTIQGLFELADIAYVGAGVLGSSAAMDKDAMKRLFASAGLPQTPYLSLLRTHWRADPKGSIRLIEKSLAYPVFVKPANLGSSVGISKVHARGELSAALDLAASFDRKLVIEQGVGGPGAKPRELEVAVLGNDSPEASVVGEIVPNKEFYDYQSKYEPSEAPSLPIIPAAIFKSEAKQIRTMAIAAFRACDCAGLARVDFLMEPARDGKGRKVKNPRIFLNEINTLPGFTSISMYPKLWQASGLSYKKLIDRLITLALERHREKLETRFTKI